jgi:hypothetical protein
MRELACSLHRFRFGPHQQGCDCSGDGGEPDQVPIARPARNLQKNGTVLMPGKQVRRDGSGITPDRLPFYHHW